MNTYSEHYCIICGSTLVETASENTYTCSKCNSDYEIKKENENTIVVLIDTDAE